MSIFLLVLVFVIWMLHFLVAGAAAVFFPNIFGRTFLIAAPLICSALFAFCAFGGRMWGVRFLSAVANYWMGFLFIFFFIAVLLIITGLILRIFGLGLPLWLGAAGAGAAVLLCLLAIIGGLKNPAPQHIKITDPALPVASFKIAQVSDSHLNKNIKLARVKATVEKINEFEPDLVLFTGDVYEDHEKVRTPYVEALREIKAKHGVYGVLGNHEYYNGAELAIKFFSESGIQLLRQETVDIEPGVQLIGIDDIMIGRVSDDKLRQTLEGSDKNAYRVMMSHQPSKLGQMASAGVNLVLCGHTHNGQIFPFSLLVKMRYPYSYGLYKIDNTYVYVTSGTFYWGPPLRLFTKNELPLITITRE